MNTQETLNKLINMVSDKVINYNFQYDEDSKKDEGFQSLQSMQLLLHLAYHCYNDIELGAQLFDTKLLSNVSRALDIITTKKVVINKLSNQICNSEFEQVCNELDLVECEYQLTQL